MPRWYYICQSCADHCQQVALAARATEFIAAELSFKEFLEDQGQGDILCVLANYKVRTLLHVSKLTWDRLHDLANRPHGYRLDCYHAFLNSH